MTEPTAASAAGAGWHVPDPVLHRYADGALDTAGTWSVEAHLPGCAGCRRRATSLVEAGRLDRVWREVEDAVDGPVPGPLERLLVRLGVAGHTARLLAATPSLRTSWLLAVALALTFGVSAAYALHGPGRSLLFLTVAPLLPLAGVAAAYGPGIDPAYEIGVVAPMSGVRLLLVRVTAVLATTVPIIAASSLLLPDIGLWAAGWLLPALALAFGGLALSSFTEPVTAATVVALGWIAVAVATVHPASGEALPFTAAGQLGCAALAAAGALGVVLRRGCFELAAPATIRRSTGSWRIP